MQRKVVIQSRIAALEEELAEIEQFGEDVYQNGDVLIFNCSFGGSVKYSYAALKAVDSWFITGGKNENSYMSWDDLVMFWRRANVSNIRVVTKTRRVR